MSYAPLHNSHMRAWLSWGREILLSLVTTRMSPVAFHLDYFLYPPIILALLIAAANHLRVVDVLALFMLGLAAWTLAEYLLHRYALHHWPYFSKFHLAHHVEPRAKIGAPTVFTLSFFFMISFLPVLALSTKGAACAYYAGFLTGYIFFAAVHETVHHSENRSRLMRYFKMLHAIHHHGSSDKNFGVTTSFWDHVFGTYANDIKSARMR